MYGCARLEVPVETSGKTGNAIWFFFASRFLTSSGQVLWAGGRFRQYQMRAVMGFVTMAVPVYLLRFLWGQGKMRLFFSGGSNSLRKSAIVCVVNNIAEFF